MCVLQYSADVLNSVNDHSWYEVGVCRKLAVGACSKVMWMEFLQVYIEVYLSKLSSYKVSISPFVLTGLGKYFKLL